MKGSIKDLHRYLAQSIVSAKMARNIVGFLKDKRALLPDEEYHSIRDGVLMLLKDVEIMDSFLGEYQCMGVSSNKFVSVGK